MLIRFKKTCLTLVLFTMLVPQSANSHPIAAIFSLTGTFFLFLGYYVGHHDATQEFKKKQALWEKFSKHSEIIRQNLKDLPENLKSLQPDIEKVLNDLEETKKKDLGFTKIDAKVEFHLTKDQNYGIEKDNDSNNQEVFLTNDQNYGYETTLSQKPTSKKSQFCSIL